MRSTAMRVLPVPEVQVTVRVKCYCRLRGIDLLTGAAVQPSLPRRAAEDTPDFTLTFLRS